MITKMNDTAEHEYGQLVQFFSWLDFFLFALMLAVSTMIGVYFGICGKKEDTPKEYLHGGKTMNSIPVAFSLVTSIISGVTLLGVPSEIYRYGTTYWLMVVSVIFAGIANNYIFLPVFYELQLTSTYEYFQLRFNHRVRVMASVLFTISLLLYIPIVVYVPALVLSQVSGINLHVITISTSILCIFYTMMGGLKAVVWTDFLQGIIMLVSTLAVITIGISYAGGFGNVWHINEMGGRIRLFEMDPSPFRRVTFWTVVLGLTFNWIYDLSVNQTMVQKSMSLPSLTQARRALAFQVLGLIVLETVTCTIGLLIYSKYHDCDPLTSKVLSRPDQLATYYVAEVASSVPGLPGLFVAGIFSAALSTMSSSLNSLGATMFEDFVRPFMKKSISDATTNKIIKFIIVTIGGVCLLFVFIVDKLGSILQLTFSMMGVTAGAMLGLYTFGILYPKGNACGALTGSISSLVIMGWIVFGAQTAIADGRMKLPLLPTSIEGCNSNRTIYQNPEILDNSEDDVFILYEISFMYYSLLGLTITMVVGMIVSHFTESPPLNEMNHALFAPFVRNYVKKLVQEEKHTPEKQKLHVIR
ncbi:Sodium-coupled monocarboxylate transporter 2 [Blattella germanica]|nr:Sodium-coupled monocarboxylate transporter 2 [Blattella germanica]